jgi:TPR repeat protein
VARLGHEEIDGRARPDPANEGAWTRRLAAVLLAALLGLMYRQADGVAQDDALATRLMDRACTDGNPDGCLNLGIAYEHGKGIAKDEPRAAKLYEEACSAAGARRSTSLRSGAPRARNSRCKARRGVDVARPDRIDETRAAFGR